MKVLVISAAFPPTRAGEADHAFHLCHHLSAHGLDVEVLTARSTETRDELSYKVHPIMRGWSWLDLPILMKCLKKCAPDGVILLYSGWLYNDHPMISFAPSIAKALLPRVTFVTQFEVIEPAFRASLFGRAIRKGVKQWAGAKDIDFHFGTLLRDSDRVIALSEDHLAKLTNRSPSVGEKGAVVPPPPLMHVRPEPNGAIRQSVREYLGAKSDDFVFVYFGFVTQGKGLETLLEGFRIVAQKRGNIRLIFVGGGRGYVKIADDKLSQQRKRYEEKIGRLPDQLGIAAKVAWTNGYAPESDQASAYLWAADACVLPFDEGIKLNNSTFAAAAAHKLPIITTRGDIVETPFRDGWNVLFCPPKNPEATAEAMEKVIIDNELRGRLKRGAFDLAQTCFSWNKAIKCTIDALQYGRITPSRD